MSHQCVDCGTSFTRVDNLKRHGASRTCSGIALQQQQHSPLENSLVTYSPDQRGAGLGYQEVCSKPMDSDIRELSEQEVYDNEEADQDSSDDEMSVSEKNGDEEKTNQDATDGDDADDDTSYGRSDSEESSDDYEDENTASSSEDEASREPNRAFKYFGNARYRFGDNVVYAAWKSRKNIPYVVRQRQWLKTLRNAKPERWRQLLSDASGPQLEAFREIAYNVLRRRVVMHRRAMLGLDKNIEEIKKLAHIGNSYEQLRHLLKMRRTDVVLRLLMWGLPRCIKSNESV